MELEELRAGGRIGCDRCVPTFRSEIRGARARHGNAVGTLSRRPLESSEADVSAIIASRMTLGRIIPGLPLSGGRQGNHPASEAAQELLQHEGYRLHGVAELDSRLLDLVKRAGAPRAWIEAEESLLAAKDGTDLLCLVDCDEHLSFRASAPGLAIRGLADLVRTAAQSFDGTGSSAIDPEFGALSLRVRDFGGHPQGEVTLHLPALERSGNLERIFRVILAEGWSVEGFHHEERGSSASIWMLSSGPEVARAPEELNSVALFIAEAEAAARQELMKRAQSETLDAVARSCGLLSMALNLSTRDALEILSTLRLGTLLGLLPDFEEIPFGELIVVECLLPSLSTRGGSEVRRFGSDSAKDRARRLRSICGLREPFVPPGPVIRIQGGP